jgi:hypothetical protein
MIAQKGRPSLRRLRTPWRSPHPAQDGSLRNIEAKHGQLAVNAWSTPGRVLCYHAEDEFAQFDADTFPARANSMPRKPCPIDFESGLMPSHNSFRLNQNQRLLPSTPESPQHHPEQSVGNGKSRLWMSLLQDRKLLPKRQVFQQQVAARTDRPNNQNEQELQQTRHEPVVTEAQDSSTIGLATDLLNTILQRYHTTRGRKEFEVPWRTKVKLFVGRSQLDVQLKRRHGHAKLNTGDIAIDATSLSARDTITWFRYGPRRPVPANQLT